MQDMPGTMATITVFLPAALFYLGSLGIALCPMVNSECDHHYALFAIGLSFLLGFIILAGGTTVSGYRKIRASKYKSWQLPFTVSAAAFWIAVLFFIPSAFVKARELTHRDACIENLEILGLVLHMYAVENRHHFPPADRKKNNFIFDPSRTYPEYMTQGSMIVCPGDPERDPENNFRLLSNRDHQDLYLGTVHPDCITGMSYCYLGWVVTSDEEAESFFEVYDSLSPEQYGKDIFDPEEGTVQFEALELGVTCRWCRGSHFTDREYEEAMATIREYQMNPSVIPILWEVPYTDEDDFSHTPAGGHVLYLDGHVEFVTFGEKFPMTDIMARLLEEHPRVHIADCEGVGDDQLAQARREAGGSP
jgi:prepilin-type processing-associated H-X9-DG protein